MAKPTQRQLVWYWLGPIVGLVVFVVDRLTKSYFVTQSTVYHDVIPGWLWFQLHLNERMALSLPLFPLVYYTLTLLVCGALLVQLVRSIHQRHMVEFSLIIFILVGAVSNLYDRLIYGGVIDFITIKFGSVFNIADISIVSAIGFWIIRLFLHDRHKKISTSR